MIRFFIIGVFIHLGCSLFSQNEEWEIIHLGEVSSIVEKIKLTGQVKEAESQEVVIGATLILNETGAGVVSQEDGSYSILLSPGVQRMEVSFLGYATRYLELHIYRDTEFEILLDKSSFQLEQVVVQERSEAQNIKSTISGIEVLDVTSLQAKTQLFGELDVLRSIQTLSGVTSAGDGASGFNVRGGNADENLILQDGALILNPTHTLGFFSLFHPDLINSVQLYKGNQPSYYGGRLSSVLEVNLREGDKDHYKLGGGVGIAASRLTIEGPIQKGRSSFIVGGRFSYMDYILNFVKNINVKRSKTFFYDLTAKADARLSDKTKVGFSSFISGDDFQFGQEVNFDYSTKTGSAYLNHLFSNKWNVNFSVNIGDYESALLDIQGQDLSRFSNGVSFLRSSLRNFIQVNEKLSFIAGVSFERYTVRPGKLEPEGDVSTVVPEELPREKGMALIPYAQIDWNILPGIKLFAGLRFTSYSALGPGDIALYEPGQIRSDQTQIGVTQYGDGEKIASFTGWEPRLGLNVSLSEDMSVKLGFHRGFQFFSQISNTSSATPIDLWKLSDPFVEPLTADNYNVGIFKNFGNNTFETSVETFYKDQKTIVDYKDFPDLLLNDFLERELVFGTGRSYGLEANFKKRKGSFKFDLNYTYSRSERKVEDAANQQAINNGDWYPSNYDKPHSFNLNVSRQIAKKASLSVAFTYSTGRPVTAPISNFTVDNILNVPLFSERNQFRIPDYHRLDVAYTIGPFTGKKNKSENRLVISIYNIYSRKNAYSVFFRQRAFQRLSTFRIATLGSVFPSITYNFTFS